MAIERPLKPIKFVLLLYFEKEEQARSSAPNFQTMLWLKPEDISIYVPAEAGRNCALVINAPSTSSTVQQHTRVSKALIPRLPIVSKFVKALATGCVVPPRYYEPVRISVQNDFTNDIIPLDKRTGRPVLVSLPKLKDRRLGAKPYRARAKSLTRQQNRPQFPVTTYINLNQVINLETGAKTIDNRVWFVAIDKATWRDHRRYLRKHQIDLVAVPRATLDARFRWTGWGAIVVDEPWTLDQLRAEALRMIVAQDVVPLPDGLTREDLLRPVRQALGKEVMPLDAPAPPTAQEAVIIEHAQHPFTPAQEDQNVREKAGMTGKFTNDLL